MMRAPFRRVFAMALAFAFAPAFVIATLQQ